MISGCGDSAFASSSGDLTIDSSSEKAFQESAKEIFLNLPESDREKFMVTIEWFFELGSMMSLLGNNLSEEEAMSRIRAKLHGKTAEETFQIAADLKEVMKR
jgi:hypothetical protein